MTPEAQLIALATAIAGLGGAVIRALWNRVERMEARTEKRLDAQEVEIKNLRSEQSDTRDKYSWLKGYTQSVQTCSVTGCPHRQPMSDPTPRPDMGRITPPPRITPRMP